MTSVQCICGFYAVTTAGQEPIFISHQPDGSHIVTTTTTATEITATKSIFSKRKKQPLYANLHTHYGRNK